MRFIKLVSTHDRFRSLTMIFIIESKFNIDIFYTIYTITVTYSMKYGIQDDSFIEQHSLL